MMVILTFSILWLSGECEDGDFDFFDIVIDWGRLGVLQQKQGQDMYYNCRQIWFLRFVETMNEMNDKKETWIRLNGWAR